MSLRRLSALAFSSLVVVFLVSQNSLPASGTLLSGGPNEDTSPEISPPEPAPDRPRRRANLLQRGLRAVSLPARRVLQTLRSVLGRRPRQEREQELASMEGAAMRYFDCFSLGSPETKAASAVSAVCAGLKTEALRQCLKKNPLFLVHPMLRESIAAASPEDYNDAEAWMSSLSFVAEPPEEFTFPGGSPLGQAYAKLNWSLIGTADNQHILAGDYLKQSTRKRRGILTEGYQLFMSLPPHPDPVAVRLLSTMLVDGLSCPADGTFGKPERVVVGGKTKTVKTAQLVEAAIYIVVGELFDASDCAAPGNTDAQARMTCRLLSAYDEYMQAGGPLQAEPKTEERLQQISGAEFEAAPALAEAEARDEGEQARGLEAGEPSSTQSSVIPSTLPSETNDVDERSEPSRGAVEGPPEPSLELPADQDVEETDGKRERIRVYAQQAAASAVATARLSLKSGATTLRLVRLCLKSSFFIRHVSRILLFFMGKELVSQQGLFLLLGRKRQAGSLLGIYIRALVELSSGSSSLGNLSAAATGIAADEEKRVISGEQQTPASFLQGYLKPTVVIRTLQAAGVETNRRTAVALALSVNVTVDIILAFLLVALSSAFPPAVLVMAIVLAILLLIRSAIISYTVAVPETMMEKIERKGKGALEKVARVVG
ncbi:uncharacterized protein EMH_0002610 [Eimeria mitis]|uniref:Transmembrane protein n=1 Tax=Eimeria mitis TaxID=44415 RepID=U6KKH1_9EIME|nr:uncharacterized protein EMH_0002610 [Eimeria mitis]CDJ35938.1 hypothetical protein, conserved [Eimeria mitis]